MNKYFRIQIMAVILITSASASYSQFQWQKLSSPTTQLLRYVSFVDSLTGWAAGRNGTIIHTSDGGRSWEVQNSNVTSFILDISFVNNQLGWGVTITDTIPFRTQLIHTTNGGNTWIVSDYQDDNIFFETICFLDSLNGWLGGDFIAGTTDGGLNWNEAHIDSGFASELPVKQFRFYNQQYGYACGGLFDVVGVIWRTTNYGQTWTSTGVSPDPVYDIHISDSLNVVGLSGDPEGFFGTGIVRTTDGGNSWTFDEMTISGLSFGLSFRTQTEGWSASGYKFLLTKNGGNDWSEVLLQDDAQVFDVIFTDEKTGYAVGEDGVIFKYVNSFTTDIENEINIPSEFILYQNYPNPFNPGTKISWQSAVDSWQILKVYDVLGNEVATLVDEEKPAGTYEVEFSVGQDAILSLSSGVYFYTLTAGEFRQTKKMILLR